MSFAYKTLSPSDITISPYTANKLYTFTSSSLTDYGIVVYSGEYEPIINVSCSDGPATGQVPCNPYNPENDVTSNGYARRLIYDSIQKLYYQSFISGGFSNVLWTSSSYENYLQTALTSGSNYLTNIRIFGQDSGSGGYFYNITSSIYDTASFPSDPSMIRVISIPQDIFGSGIKPGTFEISSSNYLIQDDGQGNLMDNKSITSSIYESTAYVSNVYGGTQNNQGIHVGNIIYSHGMVVITNEDYFCFYPTEPVAQNNSYKLLNVQPTKSLNVLINDFDDCNILDTSSLSNTPIVPLSGFNFPDNSATNGVYYIDPIAPNNLQVTPGLYKGYYYVSNSINVPSNYATVSLELYSSPLAISLVSYTTGCYSSSTPQDVTWSINYGVPPYSWSLDTPSGWTPISNLYQPTLSFTITPNPSARTLYAKDAIGEIASFVVDVNNGPILYNYTTQSILCAGGTGSIYVTTASSDTPVSVSLSPSGPWSASYPVTYSGLTSTQTLYFTNSLNCSTQSDNLPFSAPSPITATLTVFQGDCTDPEVGNVGALTASIAGGIGAYTYSWWFNGSPLVPNQNTPYPVGLQTGSYYVVVSDAGGGCNDGTSNTISLISASPISPFSATTTDVSCFGSGDGQIQYQFGGGSGSVLGAIYSGSTLLTSSGYVATSSTHTLTVTGVTAGSGYSIYAIDARGCAVTQSISVGGPIAPLSYLGDFNILRPGGTASIAPYSASFTINGGNTASYHVTLSANFGVGGLQPVASGSFAGSALPTAVSLSLSNACLTTPTTWSLHVVDHYGTCSLTSNNIYYYPTQVNAISVQYTGSNSFDACIAAFSTLFTTTSENSGFNTIAADDHIWASCSLEYIPATGYIRSGSNSYYVNNGIWPNYIEDPCAAPIPPSPPNKIYIQGNIIGTEPLSWSSLYTETKIQIQSGSYIGAASSSIYYYTATSLGFDPLGPTFLFDWTGSYSPTIYGDGTFNYTSFNSIPLPSNNYSNLVSVTVYYAPKGTPSNFIYSTALGNGTYQLIKYYADAYPTPGISEPLLGIESYGLVGLYDYLIVPTYASY